MSSGSYGARLGFNDSEKPNRPPACPGLADELHLRGPGFLFTGLCVTCGVSTVFLDGDGLPRHRPPGCGGDGSALRVPLRTRPAACCPVCGGVLAGGPVQFDCTGCGRPVHAADLSREIEPGNALYAPIAMHGLVPGARAASGSAAAVRP